MHFVKFSFQTYFHLKGAKPSHSQCCMHCQESYLSTKKEKGKKKKCQVLKFLKRGTKKRKEKKDQKKKKRGGGQEKEKTKSVLHLLVGDQDEHFRAILSA